MEQDDPDVVLLREILARELETINLYQSLIARTSSVDVTEFISHIMDEEKEHVAEAMELINQIDPRQASRFGSGAHWRTQEGGLPQETEAGGGDVIRTGEGRVFTVGSLRKPSSK
jgi:rubrerythrin